MFRARIVFNGSLNNEYSYYSAPKKTEQEIHDMLDDMKPVLAYAVSVKLLESVGGDRWYTVSAFNDDWSQRIG
jgi:hypothetical protein